MSAFETIDNIKYQLGRFLWPTIFLAIGIILLKIAFVPEVYELNNGEKLEVRQSSFFLFGSIFFIIGSIIWYLYLFGIIRTVVGYLVMGVMCVFGVYLLYLDYIIVDNDVQYMK